MSSELAAHSDFFAALFGLGLFAGMLLLVELGRRLSLRRIEPELDSSSTGIGAVEGAAFGLMGLLIAFTFSGAAERFEARRALIVQEANEVRTAWLRIDLMPADAEPVLRDGLRRYLDSRLSGYDKLADPEAARAEFAHAEQLQREIWSLAVAACGQPDTDRICGALFPALNDMFDIATTRVMAMEDHPPAVIFVLLFALALGCSVLAGYGMGGQRRKLHMVGFAAITAVSVYVILDLEYPRIGWIRVDSTDHVLRELRASMD